MKKILPAGLALAVTACASTPVPDKRPMPQAEIDRQRAVPVVVVANNDGVQKSWFMKDSSAVGAQYGLIGGLVSATMDAIANAGPAFRAQRAADEVGEVVLADALDASLIRALRTRTARMAPGETMTDAASALAPSLTLGEVATVQKILTPDATDEAVELALGYLLSEDGTALRVTAVASYEDDGVSYQTPYAFEGSVPKSQQGGPLYKNTFVYHSDQLPVPNLDAEMKEELARSVRESFRTEDGRIPVRGDDDYEKMAKEVEKARDDKLTKSEMSVFLTREWAGDGGALVRQEVSKAHDFVARYLLADLNDAEVPQMEGVDMIVEEGPDGRVVRKLGSTLMAGSYVSSPGGVRVSTTYGNAAQTSKAAHDARKALRKKARRERRK